MMTVRRRALLAAIGCAAGVTLLLATTSATYAQEAAANGPELPDFPAALAYSLTNPDAAPAGANDWSCRPSTRHPRPVVLVHGTFENRFDNFARLSPSLKRDGYCVFALNYGADGSVASQAPAVR